MTKSYQKQLQTKLVRTLYIYAASDLVWSVHYSANKFNNADRYKTIKRIKYQSTVHIFRRDSLLCDDAESRTKDRQI